MYSVAISRDPGESYSSLLMLDGWFSTEDTKFEVELSESRGE